jgi:hypothetical protein
LLFDQVVARLSGPVIKTHVALAIGIAGDVTNLERIVLGRYERAQRAIADPPWAADQDDRTFHTGAVAEMR